MTPLRYRLTDYLLLPILWLALPWALACPAAARDNTKTTKQLTQRVDQFYRLSVAGEFVKMEPFVSQDTRNFWQSHHGGKIEAYQIESVTVSPDGKRADVAVLVTFRLLQVSSAPFQQSQKSEWIFEKGKWFLIGKPRASPMETFKGLGSQTDPGAQRSPLVFDQNPVQLPPGTGAEQVVKVQYQNTNPIIETIQNLTTNCPCLKAEVDKPTLQPEQKGTLTLTYNGSLNNSQKSSFAVEAIISPSMYHLSLPVVLGKDK